jgi:argininosuccinate lyase
MRENQGTFMAQKLWDKGGEAVDQLMHELTVGDDPIVDRELVCFDCLGSAAHAKMLASVGLLSKEDLPNLLNVLAKVYEEGKVNKFDIPRELEDVHTALETRLVASCGEAGRRIHAARSRNDQALLTMRLFIRDTLVSFLEELVEIKDILSSRYLELKDVPMPGYTHLQPAMPSSLGLWLHSWLEAVLDLSSSGLQLLERLDSNPLGSGAGFGSSLKIDRKLVADLLGFSRVQRSYIDVNNSRTRDALLFLRFTSEIAGMFEKMACEFMLYLSKEFSFFALPAQLCTGSSIMPQKQNPDIVELLRGRASRVKASEQELIFLSSKMTVSYHRDYQYSKAPVMRASSELKAMCEMAKLVLAKFSVNNDRLNEVMYDELYATYDACREVQKGKPFRDAYKETAARVKDGKLDRQELEKDFQQIVKETDSGVQAAKEELAAITSQITSWRGKLNKLINEAFKA